MKGSITTINLFESEAAAIRAIGQAIAARPGRDYRFADLCRQYQLSRLKLRYGFRKLYGTSLQGFITEQRVRLAKELLTGRRMPVKEIAALCGYKHTQNFSHAFKRHTTYTPGAYQRMKDCD
jgi:AraC-like DNA-binding protein